MKILMMTGLILLTFVVGVQAQDSCYATFDVNNDGHPLTIADQAYLRLFFMYDYDTIMVPYEADINGDCIVDLQDDSLYILFTIYGMDVFDEYPVPTCCNTPQSCCVGLTGNINNDPNQLIDIFDVTYLIAYLYNDGPLPKCPFETDVNGDGARNIFDVTHLISFIYEGGPAPVACD